MEVRLLRVTLGPRTTLPLPGEAVARIAETEEANLRTRLIQELPKKPLLKEIIYRIGGS
jgi:hypothetical protein